MICSACERRDFASSLRCQWCGNPLQNGVPALTQLSDAPQNALSAPDSLGLDRPAAPQISDLAPVSAPRSSQTGLDEPKKLSLKKMGPFLGPLLLLLSKFKVILGALKFGKLATTFGSMFVSIGFYALLFGWKFAFGFVLLIFVHEMGHVIALKRRGIPIEGMFFIPFLGAAVSFKKRPRDPAVDAEISWAGPFAGLLGGAVCAAFYVSTGNVFWLALAHTTFLINLLNLAPAVPLDGGWIVKAINPKFSLFGSLIGVGIGIYLHSTMLVIIAGLGAFSAYNAWRSADDNFDQIPISPQARLRVTGAYLSLILILGAALGYSTQTLQEDRERRQGIENGEIRSAQIGGEAR
ncbi:MAG TPA: site-2 protease family protein [Abditibacterium sp.]|jgi:Zn-dependent protease